MNHNYQTNPKSAPMQRHSTSTTDTMDTAGTTTTITGPNGRSHSNDNDLMTMNPDHHGASPSKTKTKTRRLTTSHYSSYSGSNSSSNVNGSMLSSEWVLFSPSVKSSYDDQESSTATRNHTEARLENESDVLSSSVTHSDDNDHIDLVLNNESVLLTRGAAINNNNNNNNDNNNYNNNEDELLNRTQYNDFNLTGLRTRYYGSGFDEFIRNGNYLFLNRSSYVSSAQSSAPRSSVELSAQSEDEDEEGDSDDDLLDDLTHISRTINTNPVDDNVSELNSRIEDWRRDQINSLIQDLQHHSTVSNSSLNLDILKSWGIVDDDLVIQYGNHNHNENNTTTPEERANKIIKQKSQSDNHHDTNMFADSMLSKYDETELKLIKQILKKLSGALTRKPANTIIGGTHTHSPTAITHITRSSAKRRKTGKRFESGRFMNNPELQKYIPLYLKNLIVSSNLYQQFPGDDDECNETEITDSDSVSTVHDDAISGGGRFRVSSGLGRAGGVRRAGVGVGGNFWERNESVNSSVLTYSTGSILGF